MAAGVSPYALLLRCWFSRVSAAWLPLRRSAPRRIVSLVPAVTEMLFALGAGDRVVAVSSFDKYPPEVEKLPMSVRCSIRISSGSCR